MAPLKSTLMLNSSFPALKPLPGKKKNFPEVSQDIWQSNECCAKETEGAVSDESVHC